LDNHRTRFSRKREKGKACFLVFDVLFTHREDIVFYVDGQEISLIGPEV